MEKLVKVEAGVSLLKHKIEMHKKNRIYEKALGRFPRAFFRWAVFRKQKKPRMAGHDSLPRGASRKIFVPLFDSAGYGISMF
jgi:hypothetical protein